MLPQLQSRSKTFTQFHKNYVSLCSQHPLTLICFLYFYEFYIFRILSHLIIFSLKYITFFPPNNVTSFMQVVGYFHFIPFYCWLTYYWTIRSHIVYPFTFGWTYRVFPLLDIRNKYSYVHLNTSLWEESFLFLLGKHLWMECWVIKEVYVCLNKKLPNCLPNWLCPPSKQLHD